MAGVSRGPDPVKREIMRNLLTAVAEEMGLTLQRTSYSPNIKERRDFSCAVFDSSGDLCAQASHIPVHLGSAQESVKWVMRSMAMSKGDAVILNDPYRGGTHLPDITLVSPVFTNKDKPSFYVANRAHHADIGGVSPGSMPMAKKIEDEGIVISPTKIVVGGVVDEKVRSWIINSTRTPRERVGDLNAQLGANAIGVKRLEGMVAKYGEPELVYFMDALMEHSERMMRHVISDIPDGVYKAQDVMDDDGFGTKDIPIVLTLTKKGDTAHLDFTGSSPQVPGGINAVLAITYACAFYVFRCIAGFDIPPNSGIFRPLSFTLPERSIVNAAYPSPVVGGNVETSQRIADVILRALAQALPGRIPAAGEGTMNNIAIGGEGYTYYETVGGGMGASAKGPGTSAVQVHMTNTLNTPVEAIEHEYPFRITRYGVRRGSGGVGKHRGGDGIVREYEFSGDAEVTIISERRTNRPWGLEGGGPGAAGKNVLISGGLEKELPGKVNFRVKKGDRVRVETPGGGGYGKA